MGEGAGAGGRNGHPLVPLPFIPSHRGRGDSLETFSEKGKDRFSYFNAQVSNIEFRKIKGTYKDTAGVGATSVALISGG